MLVEIYWSMTHLEVDHDDHDNFDVVHDLPLLEKECDPL